MGTVFGYMHSGMKIIFAIPRTASAKLTVKKKRVNIAPGPSLDQNTTCLNRLHHEEIQDVWNNWPRHL